METDRPSRLSTKQAVGLLVMLFGLAAVLFWAGRWRWGGGADRFGSRRIEPGDRVAAQFRNALSSGMAFDASFLHYPDAETPEQGTEARRQAQLGMNEMLRHLPDHPVFGFLDGVEVTFPTVGRGVAQIGVRLKDDEGNPPSKLQLSRRCPRQMYLIYSAPDVRGPDSTQAYHLLCWFVDGQWRCVQITGLMRRLHGTTFATAFDAAQKEHEAGRNVVALALAAMAAKVSRAPSFRASGRQQAMEAMTNALAEALGLPDKPAATVTTQDGPIDIAAIDAAWLDGPYLVLRRRAPRFCQGAKPDEIQWRIAAAFGRKHPETRRHFQGIVVEWYFTDGDHNVAGFVSKFPWANLQRPASSRPSSQARAARPVPVRLARAVTACG